MTTGMSQGMFWKTVVSGIVVIAGLAGGVVGWGMKLNNACVIQEVKTVDHERRIMKLEAVVESVDKKLDIVIQQTQPRGK